MFGITGLKYYFARFGLKITSQIAIAKFIKTQPLLTLEEGFVSYPFYIRHGTSDLSMYDQVFSDDEYNFEVAYTPEVIIDAGANIGAASVYFANKYPDAKIIAIEPESTNYKMLELNTRNYPNIIPVHAALWDKNQMINLMDPGLSECAFMTQEKDENEPSLGDYRHLVQGLTIDKIMEDNNIEVVDILKIDIEGAEKEVFADPSQWIDNITSLIIELHERMKKGCHKSVYAATESFDLSGKCNDNVYFSNNNYLTEPA